MIEYVRRSLIQKAIEGNMKILAAGTLADGTAVNFPSPGEGKTTFTMINSSIYSSTTGSSNVSGILKGTGTVSFGSERLGNTVAVTTNSIKQVMDMEEWYYISYIVFEIDE